MVDIPPESGSKEELAQEEVPAGMMIGKYPVHAVVGRGGMGVVYHGTHPSMGIDVAVKTLSIPIGSSPQKVEEFRSRFLREARMAARVVHPNLIRVYDVETTENECYMALEYVDGGTAADLLRTTGGRLDLLQALDITIAVAQVLEAAAHEGIVHRDIKPSNIMLNSEGQVKLADLGLAKLYSGIGADLNSTENNLTLSGMAVGTPRYISPEQAISAKDADIRADIYSLGATLYHFVTGRPPYTGKSGMDVMIKHVSYPFPDPRTFNSALPDEVCDLLRKMMEKKPEDRHQTPAELIAHLQAVRAAVMKSAPASDTAPKAPAADRQIASAPKTDPSPSDTVRGTRPVAAPMAAHPNAPVLRPDAVQMLKDARRQPESEPDPSSESAPEQTATARPTARKRALLPVIVAIVIVVILLAAGNTLFRRHRQRQQALAMDLARVVQDEDIEAVRFVGTHAPEHLNELVSMAGRDYTPLGLAAVLGKTEIGLALARHGAGISKRDRHDNTPLHYAAAHGHVETIKMLLEAGASIEAPGQGNATPLHFAVDHDQPEAVKCLLEQGATVDSLDYHQNTPLHHAAERGRTKCAAILLAAGANVHAANEMGRTPLHLATTPAVAALLLDKGARADARDRYRRTPLHTAAREGHRAVVDLLIEAGSPVNALDLSRETPLDIASGPTAELLLQHGARTGR